MPYIKAEHKTTRCFISKNHKDKGKVVPVLNQVPHHEDVSCA